MSKRPISGLDEHQKAFIKLIEANARRHRKHEAFRDFCEMAAISLSNAVDVAQAERREARYMQLVGRYEREEVARFPQMLAHIVQSLEYGMHDCLGQLFMALELGDHWKGQYFTPYPVAYLMAELGCGDVAALVGARGYFTANEPAAGAGAMVIALADCVRNKGMNYQRCLHVTAQDLDETAVHMSYIQLTLLHIPAVVVHGNSLWPKDTDQCWYTAAHVFGGWSGRLARLRADAGGAGSGVSTPMSLQPEVTRSPDSHPSMGKQRPTKPRFVDTEQISLFD